VAQPRGIGVLKRLVEIEADILGAPRIVKAYVEQVRAERQLEGDTDMIERAILTRQKTLFDGREEAFGVLVPNAAEMPAFSGTSKPNEFAWNIYGHPELANFGRRQRRQRRCS
jgi:hypothetical protein